MVYSTRSRILMALIGISERMSTYPFLRRGGNEKKLNSGSKRGVAGAEFDNLTGPFVEKQMNPGHPGFTLNQQQVVPDLPLGLFLGRIVFEYALVVWNEATRLKLLRTDPFEVVVMTGFKHFQKRQQIRLRYNFSGRNWLDFRTAGYTAPKEQSHK